MDGRGEAEEIRGTVKQQRSKDNNSPSFSNPSPSFPSQEKKNHPNSSLGPQLSGKEVFHWTRRITECPKL